MYRCGHIEFDLVRKENGDLRLMVGGSDRYKTVITEAFPSLKFARPFPDKFGRYDWGIFIKAAGAPEEAALREFCTLLQDILFIEDDLDEEFALSFHRQFSPSGGYPRTPIESLSTRRSHTT
jgi:hypothetical protein